MRVKIYIILASLLMSSCIKKFDMSNPNAELITNTTSLKDTKEYLVATYNALYDQDIWDFDSTENAADMGFPGGNDRYGVPTYEIGAKFYYQTYTNSLTLIAKKYAAIYTVVYRANMTIRELNSLVTDGYVESNNEEWIGQMCQARALRGLSHLFVHSLFNNGDVIMFDRVPDLDSAASPLSKSEDVVSFFRDDFNYAINNWPESLDIEDGMISSNAVRCFLGMSHLYEREWQETLDTLQPVIEDKSLSLVRDLDLLFSIAGEFNTESIFEVNYKEDANEVKYGSANCTVNSFYNECDEDFTYPAWLLWEYQQEKLNPYDIRNVVVDKDDILEYTMKSTLLGEDIVIHQDTEVIDPDLLAQMSTPLEAAQKARYRTVSMRASATSIIGIDNDHQYYKDTPQTSMSFTPGPKSSLAHSRKFLNWDLYANENEMPYGKNYSGKNLILMRLATVYLMYAEAQIELGNIKEGLRYLNRIRDRWGLELLGQAEDSEEYSSADHSFNGVDYTQATLRKQLRDIERPLELSQEGFATRFIDLRRWSVDGDTYTSDRYQALAEDKWVMAQFYYDGADTSKLPSNKLLVKLDDETQAAYDANGLLEDHTIFRDFERAADNVGIRKRYLPIPLTEIQNNPNLEKNGVTIQIR